MCGIVAMVGKENVVPKLVEGLKRLEYRGYDSAGVSTLVEGRLERRRAKGKISMLEELLAKDPVAGTVGIAHTRWATHGVPNVVNAHPHANDMIAVVHNGIIENYQELRTELKELGHVFETETDTEVIAHLMSEYIKLGLEPDEALKKTLERLEGAYALAILVSGRENFMLCARQGSPLAIGYGDEEMFAGSDAVALAPYTRKVCYLEEGDWASITTEGAQIFDQSGQEVTRPIRETDLSASLISKGEFSHFMLKETFEQPEVVGAAIHRYVDLNEMKVRLPEMPFNLSKINRVTLIACGTSYNAAMIAKYWLEAMARVPVEVDIASEFRYRAPVLEPGGLALFISQSGETADTLAALRHAKNCHQHIVGMVNQSESSIARESDVVLPILAGVEIGVASTKAFTCQLAVFSALAVAFAREKGFLDAAAEKQMIEMLIRLPSMLKEVLKLDPEIEKVAELLVEAKSTLFVGRGTSYPLALEGALKLKELSYIHAEAYAAGELKHGPIALIDESMPTVVIAPSDVLLEKTISNVQEIMARGGPVIMITDAAGAKRIPEVTAKVILPDADSFFNPILYSIPLQLLSFHVANKKGLDVDQPRNLAKSVTVE